MNLGDLVGGVLALGAGVFAYAALIERNWFRVRTESIAVLGSAAAEIRVLHLSDIHLAPWQRRKVRWIRSLRRLNPDLVVVTGDSLGHIDSIPALARALEPFAGIPGVIVHGSNDYFAPRMPNPFVYLVRPSEPDEEGAPLDTAALDALYASLGWIDVDNTASPIVVNGSTLVVAGTDDPHLGRDDCAATATRLDAERVREPNIDVVIGVTHAPYRRVLDTLTELGAAVIFAGHTHGGQVCVPGFGALTTNSDLPRQFARGLASWHRNGRTSMVNVSAGIGTSIFAPVRFACPPEAVLVTLRARDFGYA
jgi:predicted MPP superfamily phosphohydrolase